MTRSRFDLCLGEVLRHEGGYVDHPSDPGGATNMGITRRTLADWRKVSPWSALDKAEVRTLQHDEVAAIYRTNYWDRSGAGSLPPGLDLALLDFAVNSGPDRAVRTLQAELAVAVDGRIGPQTLAAVRTRIALKGGVGLIDLFCDRRLAFLGQLSTYAVFGKGWSARVAAIRKAAKAAATASTSSNGDTPMDILNGYKTYITAAIMLLAGLAQMLGIDLPALDGGSAAHLVMEALAVMFLRKGLKGEAARG